MAVRTRIIEPALAKFVQPGKNSKVFVDIINAAGQRSVVSKVSMSTLAKAMLELLLHLQWKRRRIYETSLDDDLAYVAPKLVASIVALTCNGNTSACWNM